MAEYIGRRIVPTHGGVWNETKEYEELTIVLDEESGDSYISRIPVPSGTALDDEEYWMLFSIYSEQIQEALDAIEETSEEMVAYVDKTAASLTEYVQDTATELTEQVEAAEDLTESNKDDLNERMETIEARLDANVTASTDSDADYAAEVVDARVDSEANTYDSLGAHIRAVGAQLNATDELIYEDITGEVTEGSFVDARNGGVRTASSTWTQTCYVSDLIAIDPDAQKIFYTGKVYNYIGVAGYDSSGTYVAAIIDITEDDDDYATYEDYELTIPDGVTQIRASSYGNELKITAVTSAGALAEQIEEINAEIDSMVWSGAKTAYILNGEITINVDYDEGTGDIQLTHSGNAFIFKSDGGADSNLNYTLITAEDEPTELNTVNKSSRILALDDSTGKINIYTDKQFRALGENGYYIAAMWSNKFVNANINPGVSIVLNGTTYQAGDLLLENSSTYNTYVESRYQNAMAELAEEAINNAVLLSGAKTAYMLNGEITINVDYDEGTGDIQLTHSGNGFLFKSDGGADSKCDYTVITAEDEATDLNTVNKNARILALDDSTGKINIYTDAQFRALGENGYYIAAMWSNRFVNANMNPSVSIVLNGTTYKAGDLFYENSSTYNTYVESRYQNAIEDAVEGLESDSDAVNDTDGRGDIVSPSHWDCMEGRQLSIFLDCLSRHEDRKEMYRIQNSMSLYRNEYCLNYTPASDDEDFDITIVRMNKGTMTIAESKDVTVKVHHPLTTSLTKNVCICGDSLVDNKYLAQEVWDMLDEDGDCVINHIGTRGGTGYEHEGRGSWSWATYIQGEEYSSKTNPFWDSDNECLNFQKYCEDNGYDGIDYFLVGLGTNDVGLGSTKAKTETQIQAIITRAKTFIDALLSEDYGYPNCKIGIGLPGPAAVYSSYASWSTAIFRNCINSLNLAYIEAFDDGAYNENVTCFAYGLRTDRMHAFPYTESAVNDRFEETCLTFTEATGSSSHPSQRGYQAWADGYYCQIRAWLTEDAEAEETEEAQG